MWQTARKHKYHKERCHLKNYHPILGPVIQSEVSQKEKNKYRILMHVYASLVAQW